MRLTSFRIKNFRSIIDTGVVYFSTDNVTALVGQNESGKTAILEALATTFGGREVILDDLRHDDPAPEIWISSQWTTEEIEAAAAEITDEGCRRTAVGLIKAEKCMVRWKFKTVRDSSEESGLTTEYCLEGVDLNQRLRNQLMLTKGLAGAAAQLIALATKREGESSAEADTADVLEDLDMLAIKSATEFEGALYEAERSFVLFDEQSGLLPDRIDITDSNTLQTSAAGRAATSNFLTIAKVKLKALLDGDTRARAATLTKANKQITSEFLAFWSQTLGQQSKLRLECAVHRHPHSHERVGKNYLEFLILDDAATLYPKQRSRGTRWFLSFFLQLRASEMTTPNNVFLLDEPGSNLHEKAQDDVLMLMESIKEKIGIVYSTHSPHLINEKFFHRILAVERDSSQELHPTRVIGAHRLGAASTDTLSPIFTAMGVSLSRQTSIKKSNNVILEELSSFYYLKAFWILTASVQEVHFLPATGTSNVVTFAQLFLGWGLDFLAVLDDEPSGRAVYKQLKRDLFLDDEELAAKRLIKVTNCEGIEDIFDLDDYKKYVLNSTEAHITQTNAKWAKVNGAAKAIHALKFLQSVEIKEFVLTDLKDSTQNRIVNLVSRIAERLANYEK